jgi:hypothetical protein
MLVQCQLIKKRFIAYTHNAKRTSVIHLNLLSYLRVRLEAYPESGVPYGALLSWAPVSRLGWKQLTVTNTLAYYRTEHFFEFFHAIDNATSCINFKHQFHNTKWTSINNLSFVLCYAN